MQVSHDTLSQESPAKAPIQPCETRAGFSATGSAENPFGQPRRFWRVLAMVQRNMSNCLYKHLAIYVSERSLTYLKNMVTPLRILEKKIWN